MIRVRQNLGTRIGVAASMLFFIGCAGLGKSMEPPRVSLAHIRPTETKGLEAVFQIELRVFNTNDVPIEIKGVDCELELNGRKFARGMSRIEKKIPAYDTGIIPINIYSSVVDIIRSLLNLQGKEKIRYKMTGRLRLGEGGFLMPALIPFKSEGELSLEAMKSAT